MAERIYLHGILGPPSEADEDGRRFDELLERVRKRNIPAEEQEGADE
jgi:hypothetical protein